jgi:hypothetical protein
LSLALLLQTTLADSFLNDLDELGDLSEEDDDDVPGGHDGGGAAAGAGETAAMSDGDDDDDDEVGDLDDVLVSLKDATGVRSVAKLRVLPRFVEHMRAVEAALLTTHKGALLLCAVTLLCALLHHCEAHLRRGGCVAVGGGSTSCGRCRVCAGLTGALEDDPEYKLIVTSNTLMNEIDDEIASIHKYVMDVYSKKFPSLESIVTDTMDYFKVVMAIKNEMVRVYCLHRCVCSC